MTPRSFAIPSSAIVRDIDNLSSLDLADLGAIFWIGSQGQPDLVATITSLQPLIVEGPRREDELYPKATTNSGSSDD